MAKETDNKKDLTGILDLQRLQAENPEAMAEVPQDPFAVNDLSAVEQVDHFDSIDQIGMMDHPEAVPVESTTTELRPKDDPFQITPTEESPQEITSFTTEVDPFAVNVEQTGIEVDSFAVNVESPGIEADPFAVTVDQAAVETSIVEVQSVEKTIIADPPLESNTTKIREYSERSQGKTNLEIKIHYPFHLKISGTFGPYERDKLLLFISECSIGLSSSDLDLQLQCGKVFLPRISEFAAVKLVQELRDSGLHFSLLPSDQNAESNSLNSSSLEFHYESSGSSSKNSTLLEIPIMSEQALTQKSFLEIDQVSIVQYVRTELLEVENSPIIQEVIERMTESLKQKARLKGGNALLHLKQEILPLRLPSQYQISLNASVIKVDP